jgi:hypothetical protein
MRFRIRIQHLSSIRIRIRIRIQQSHWIRIQFGSGSRTTTNFRRQIFSRFLKCKLKVKKYSIIIVYYFALFSFKFKKLQKCTLLFSFYCLWIPIRNPDSEPGSTKAIESGSNPDPQPCVKTMFWGLIKIQRNFGIQNYQDFSYEFRFETLLYLKFYTITMKS